MLVYLLILGLYCSGPWRTHEILEASLQKRAEEVIGRRWPARCPSGEKCPQACHQCLWCLPQWYSQNLSLLGKIVPPMQETLKCCRHCQKRYVNMHALLYRSQLLYNRFKKAFTWTCIYVLMPALVHVKYCSIYVAGAFRNSEFMRNHKILTGSR